MELMGMCTQLAPATLHTWLLHTSVAYVAAIQAIGCTHVPTTVPSVSTPAFDIAHTSVNATLRLPVRAQQLVHHLGMRTAA